MLFDNKINVVVCTNCYTKLRAESTLLYDDPEIKYAIWWDPNHDLAVDECVESWRKMYGWGFYLANARRVNEWNEFKRDISRTYDPSQDTIISYGSADILHCQTIELPAEIKHVVKEEHLNKQGHMLTREQYSEQKELNASSVSPRSSFIGHSALPTGSKYPPVELKKQNAWKIISMILLAMLVTISIALLSYVKTSDYYPNGNYELYEQENLIWNYLEGEDRVCSYEKAYFWTIVANANGAKQHRMRYHLEEKLPLKRVIEIQRKADKWHRKHTKN